MARSTPLLSALLLLAPAGAALAQPPEPTGDMRPDRGPIVTMSITESVEAAPDIATINTGVETRAMTAKDAMAQNARQIDAVIGALLKAGIERKDIQTSGINLNPQYDYSARKDGEGPRFLGYSANNTLTVVLRKLDKAGETVDAMVNAGATNINGPSFSIADTSKIEAEARAKAIRTAQERASAYAKAAGFSSVRLLAINEAGQSGRPIIVTAMRDAAMAPAPATKVEPGQLSTSITLGFRYMLER